jgi:hypothetical protein
MQDYVGSHWRHDPALWCALVGVPQLSHLQHTGVPPCANPPQNSPITNPLLDQCSPTVPVQVVEQSTHLRLVSPGNVQLPAHLAPGVQRLGLPVALPEAVGHVMQVLLDDRLQDHPHRPLDPLVLEAGCASRPLRPLFLLDPHPLDWRRHLPMVAQPLMPVPEVVVQVFGLPPGRHLLHPRRTVLAGQPRGFQQALPGDHVQPGVAHHLRLACRLLRTALALHGYGW